MFFGNLTIHLVQALGIGADRKYGLGPARRSCMLSMWALSLDKS